MIVNRFPDSKTLQEDPRPYLPVTDLHFEGISSGFERYFISMPSGLRPDSYDPVRQFLRELVGYFTVRLGCSHESFIQVHQMREEATAHLFADNARRWFPETGLGVWPHRPAPRMWKVEDMEEIDSASEMLPLLPSVFRVTADGDERMDAMTTMTSSGCGLQLISRIEGSIMLQNLSELFLSFIEDRVFRIFPWYVPLITKAVLKETMESLAAEAMRNLTLYIRESPEDGGILIVSVEPLAEIYPLLGCKQKENDDKPVWTLRG